MKFFVPGEPVGKGRPRFTTRNGFARAYTPSQTLDYENQIRDAYLTAGGKLLEGPICIGVTAWLRMPGSASKRKKTLMTKREILPEKRPDLDNIVKAVLDGLNKAAYKDDSHIVSITAVKVYSPGEPFLEVDINKYSKEAMS